MVLVNHDDLDLRLDSLISSFNELKSKDDRRSMYVALLLIKQLL